MVQELFERVDRKVGNLLDDVINGRANKQLNYEKMQVFELTFKNPPILIFQLEKNNFLTRFLVFSSWVSLAGI